MEKYLIDFKSLREALAEHLRKYRKYSDEEVELSLYDFNDPYDYELCDCRFVEDTEIDGKRYEKRAYWIDFAKYFGSSFYMYYYDGMSKEEEKALKQMDKIFRFYVYFEMGPDFGNTVGEYREANRFYQVKKLDKEDSNKT